MKSQLEISQLYNNSKLVSKYASSKIIDKYKEVYGFDVSRFFDGISEVQLRKEITTGYLFFYPFNLDGDAEFYKELQKIPWYYADWKWEFDIALDLIQKDSRVVEVGCGKGAFLNRLKEKCECIGLELNDEAEAKDYNVTILNNTIEEFAVNASQEYDWVISFQVLEHIADIHSFIIHSLKILKKGGKLLIAVPNNQAKFFNSTNIDFKDQEYLKALLLNMPPHHMGKWDLNVFRKIQKIYNLELVFYKMQKAQPWRKELNKVLIHQRYKGIFKKIAKKVVNNNRTYNILSKISPGYQYGDCILVVFKKK